MKAHLVGAALGALVGFVGSAAVGAVATMVLFDNWKDGLNQMFILVVGLVCGGIGLLSGSIAGAIAQPRLGTLVGAVLPGNMGFAFLVFDQWYASHCRGSAIARDLSVLEIFLFLVIGLAVVSALAGWVGCRVGQSICLRRALLVVEGDLTVARAFGSGQSDYQHQK